MRGNRTPYSENFRSKYLKSIIWGTFFGCSICTLLLFLATFLFVKVGYIQENAINIITLMVTCFGALCGSYIAVRIAGQNGLFIGAVVGFIMFLIVLTVSLSVINEPLTVLTLTKAAIMCISGAIGGVIAVNKKRKN